MLPLSCVVKIIMQIISIIHPYIWISYENGVFHHRIFAGLCTWRLPKPEELVIECAELTEGTVCFGDLKLLPAKTEAA